MSHLDLIVTCDTSIAHLAGALGLVTWVALKKVAEWRWLRDREDSPWYPMMRLFRQQRRGDWMELFSRMAAVVEPLARSSRHIARKRTIAVPSGVGELIDKITILEIKSEKISDEKKLRNVTHELSIARALQVDEGLGHRLLDELTEELKAVNAQLWEIEDAIRLCEKRRDFGPSFVSLARSVYRLNDRRAELKHEINLLFNSAIVEEKSYA